MNIIPLIFWGSTVLSIGVSVAGLIMRSRWMLIGGAVLAGPIAFYLGATPRFRTWAFFLPCLQIGAAVVVRRSIVLATVLLVPLLSFTIWLAVIVMRQNVWAA